MTEGLESPSIGHSDHFINNFFPPMTMNFDI